MRKIAYSAPKLNLQIMNETATNASHCGTIVSAGPHVNGHPYCEDYGKLFGTNSRSYNLMSNPKNIQFYQDTNCDCYYSAGDGFFTS